MNKEFKELTFKEKKEYIKWQIELIKKTETYTSHYLCIDFWKWLNLKNKDTYINTGYNLMLFPELLNAIRLGVRKSKGSFVLSHTSKILEASPLYYGTVKKNNLFRLKFLKNLKFR